MITNASGVCVLVPGFVPELFPLFMLESLLSLSVLVSLLEFVSPLFDSSVFEPEFFSQYA